jgi:hypothetical protein
LAIAIEFDHVGCGWSWATKQGRISVSDTLRDNYPWLAELEARERAIAIVQTEAAYAAGFLRNLASVIRENGLDDAYVDDCEAVGKRLEEAIAKAMERGK